jgi:CheY-like chemotaxis protein
MQTQKIILIVEDSPDDAEFLMRRLKVDGFVNPVHHVASCLEAVACVEGTGKYADRATYPVPGLIFLDLNMPGMNGFKFLEWIRSFAPYAEFVIIALSGAKDSHSIHEAYRLGTNSFLAKPIRQEDLINLAESFPNYLERAISANFSTR